MTMNMSNKQLIVGAVLLVSLAVNAILIQQRLERQFYNKGFIDGAGQVNTKLIQEVGAKGQIVVKMPDGKPITLKAVRTTQQAQPVVVPTVPSRTVIESKAKEELPIDAMKGTIDNQEVNKP